MEPYESQQLVARELSPNEKLLWSDQPKQGIVLQAADAFLIPFSLLWCGFAIFWESLAVGKHAPVFFDLWGIPFVAIGLYMVFGRFLVDARVRRNTVYALTNERVLIIGGLFRRQVKSISLRTLNDISLNERADGSGTITLGPDGGRAVSYGSGWPGNQRVTPPMLVGIGNARSVYEMLRQAAREA